MGTYSNEINGVVDAIIDRLNDNSRLLLNPFVVERVAKPPVVANTVSYLPTWYVIPLIKGDGIRILMDDEASLHDISVDLEGYYWFEDNVADQDNIRFARDLLFNTAELFKGSGCKVGSGYISNIVVHPDVFIIGDKVIHKLSINLRITMYN